MAFSIQDTLKQSHDAVPFSKQQITDMLALPPDSVESYAIMAEAKRISKSLTQDRAEVHGQFAINLSPCPKNCKFCSFAVCNGIFKKASQLSPEEVVEHATMLESQGVNAIYIMATANYPFGKFCEAVQETRAQLKPETMLIGNVSDQELDGAQKLADAGLNGVYHALRLREGIDTGLQPEARKNSIRSFKDAGLVVGTCVEPVGPEHSNEELAEMILFTASFDPAFSGAARRIEVPGTEIAARGMISELRMAQIVAVTRLAMPRSVTGNCTHEPYSLGAAAGANLFWAELGANPRDIKEHTEEGRGFTTGKCSELFRDADCGILKGPSQFFRKH
ncbi:radical SAM protein [Desulfobaculum bizertense]|uniref:Biotin synthase n=1 Tax=Desulfobaculum bizertense DSM 18034 TaxID=1121442 RepID=A0A1T4VGD3_9BACT|nr:radical SAM protein [Desulfobaculum bizertense]SKA63908.1 biotin synthase [Desulfobaculum bizertense DSM 18034]